MEEILASIRRIIADDQALAASESEPRGQFQQTDVNGEGADRASRRPVLISNATDASARAAFNTLLASRFVQHSDVIIGLTREMLRPMLKAWLDENLPLIVERLVAAEIERVARGE
jgi:cell pole-organizing protein PopZ